LLIAANLRVERDLKGGLMQQVQLKQLAISDSGLIFDPSTGTISTSNGTGVEILRGLIEGKSPREVASALASKYDTQIQAVERDVHDFLLQLKGFGFVDE
jgi:hypothetical protein